VTVRTSDAIEISKFPHLDFSSMKAAIRREMPIQLSSAGRIEIGHRVREITERERFPRS
jgi:hypothetical protein